MCLYALFPCLGWKLFKLEVIRYCQWRSWRVARSGALAMLTSPTGTSHPSSYRTSGYGINIDAGWFHATFGSMTCVPLARPTAANLYKPFCSHWRTKPSKLLPGFHWFPGFRELGNPKTCSRTSSTLLSTKHIRTGSAPLLKRRGTNRQLAAQNKHKIPHRHRPGPNISPPTDYTWL